MRIVKGDLFAMDGWIVIPTNTMIKKDGTAVMGAGVALEAAQRCPELPQKYGNFLRNPTNPQEIMVDRVNRYILIPTKDRPYQKSSLKLIKTGVDFLKNPPIDEPIFLPKIGCGLGQLSLEVVLPVLAELDDQFTLVLEDS